MNDYGALNIIKLRHLLTPVAIDYTSYTVRGIRLDYNSLYIFGVRIARWRCDE